MFQVTVADRSQLKVRSRRYFKSAIPDSTRQVCKDRELMGHNQTARESYPHQQTVSCGDGMQDTGAELISKSHSLAAFRVIAGDVHFGPNKVCLTQRAEEAQSSKTD
jgi:hypothetical protein